MGHFHNAATRAAALVLTSCLLVAGCSSSSDSPALTEDDNVVSDIDSIATTAQPEADPTSSEVSDEVVVSASDSVEETSEFEAPTSDNIPAETIANDQISEPTTEAVPDPFVQNRTQVDFGITVPAYQSDALQVRLTWGETDVTAGWVGDELWSVSVELPTNTENTLSETFSDRNGGIVLASFEQSYRTGINASETYTISSDQFNTESLDADEDGVSNIDELISGTDPLVDEDVLLEVRDFVVINYAVTASSNFESRITEDRPYTESFDTSLPPVEFQPEIETHSVDISINDFGDGTLFDRFTHGLSGNSRTLRGTRFNDDGSVTWTGTWDFFNRQANGNSTSLDITNTVTYVDSTTRDYTDVVSATRSEFYFRSWQIASNLRGNIIEGSRLCEPVSGNVSMEVRTNATTGSASRIEFISTNISKEVDDQYWRVVVENSIESPTETVPSEGSEYFARNLRVLLLDVNANSGVRGEDSVFEEASFICDLVEFR